MATARPVVSVYQFDNPSEKSGSMPMPGVLTAPIRPDLVRYVHMNMSKNKRQAYGVGAKVGYDTAAESWGTGRAVARIPRAPGGGTHRAGQAAFGNQARGGGMFCPTKIWRRWHRRVNVTEKRHAVVTCLAASTLTPLVMARGHRVEGISELPCVVSDGIESLQKTKAALDCLKKLGCEEELKRVIDSKKVHSGKGKMRNRRYTMRRGPLVVYNEDNGIVRAMRNIPGVETASVNRLNLLKLAPGATFGRFIIYTEGAFKKLNEIYGTAKGGAPGKKGYTMPRASMANADVARIINSNEVQSVLRPAIDAPKSFTFKVNPLKSKNAMARLYPGFIEKRKAASAVHDKSSADAKKLQGEKKARVEASKKYNKTAIRKGDETFYKTVMAAFNNKAAETMAKPETGSEAASEE